MGHSVSPAVIGVVVVVFIALVLASKVGLLGGSGNGSSTDRSTGQGRRYQCQRCGDYFQTEHVEAMADGQTRKWIDDRCPHCGFDKDYRDSDHDNRADRYEHHDE